jgi:hypothetical protein
MIDQNDLIAVRQLHLLSQLIQMRKTYTTLICVITR